MAVLASVFIAAPAALAAPAPDPAASVDTTAAAELDPAASVDATAAVTQIMIWNATSSQTGTDYWKASYNQPANYVAPVNYAGGKAYIKIVVETKPSTRLMAPLVCFWRHADGVKFKYETCKGASNFTRTGTYYSALGTPTTWWKKGGSYDWRYPFSIGRIMLSDPANGQLFMVKKCGTHCYRGGDIGTHMPVRMTSQLIFVAQGATLAPPADWVAGCPRTWSPLCRG
jgi:hypothetical protein